MELVMRICFVDVNAMELFGITLLKFRICYQELVGRPLVSIVSQKCYISPKLNTCTTGFELWTLQPF
jgi:hypothetical protein